MTSWPWIYWLAVGLVGLASLTFHIWWFLSEWKVSVRIRRKP